MSIESEIIRLEAARDNAFSALESKGVPVPNQSRAQDIALLIGGMAGKDYIDNAVLSTVNLAYNLTKNESYEEDGSEYGVILNNLANLMYNSGRLTHLGILIRTNINSDELIISVSDGDELNSTILERTAFKVFTGVLNLVDIDPACNFIIRSSQDIVITQVTMVAGGSVPAGDIISLDDLVLADEKKLEESKRYTDTKIGDIDTVLDNILNGSGGGAEML